MNALRNLKNNKSVGHDSISNEMIKNAPKVILDLLHRLFNLCIEKGLIPKTWSLDLISLIHKKGDPNDLGNYRGICISSPLLKILCTLLNNRVLKFCKENNLINKNQIGFQKESRTADHLLTLKSLVKNMLQLVMKSYTSALLTLKELLIQYGTKDFFINSIKMGFKVTFWTLLKIYTRKLIMQ